MTKYCISNFGNPDGGMVASTNRLLRNTILILKGAAMAMQYTSHYRLMTTFGGETEIYFETNHINFVQSLAAELSNYGVKIVRVE